jgi:hypothetical protein
MDSKSIQSEASPLVAAERHCGVRREDSASAKENMSRLLKQAMDDDVKKKYFMLGLGSGAALQASGAFVLVMVFAYDPASGAIHELCAECV